MRGDQSARQWRAIRAIEAGPSGLTVAETAQREEKGFRTIYRDLEAPQAAGFSLCTQRVEKANRWALIDSFNSKSIHFVTQSRKVRQEKLLLDHLPFMQFARTISRRRKGPLRPLRLGVRQGSPRPGPGGMMTQRQFSRRRIAFPQSVGILPIRGIYEKQLSFSGSDLPKLWKFQGSNPREALFLLLNQHFLL